MYACFVTLFLHVASADRVIIADDEVSLMQGLAKASPLHVSPPPHCCMDMSQACVACKLSTDDIEAFCCSASGWLQNQAACTGAGVQFISSDAMTRDPSATTTYSWNELTCAQESYMFIPDDCCSSSPSNDCGFMTAEVEIKFTQDADKVGSIDYSWAGLTCNKISWMEYGLVQSGRCKNVMSTSSEANNRRECALACFQHSSGECTHFDWKHSTSKCRLCDGSATKNTGNRKVYEIIIQVP
jgi:hypothetical protein